MNKIRKGFLTAGSIISIVSASFSILLAIIMFFMGSFFTPEIIKTSYQSDPAYTYYEDADGSYYFTYIEEETNLEVIIYDEEIDTISKVLNAMFDVIGIVVLGFAIAKLVLAIRILILNNKDQYSKGCVIALLVLSIINANVLETVFLIVAMCENKLPKPEEPKDNEVEINVDDINVEDVM